MILAGDIGGTNARLALCTPDGKRIVRQDAIPSRDQPSLERIVKAFLGPRPPSIRAATLGIAGPVVGGRVQTTNLPWVLDERSLSRKLGIAKVTLINDLVALGLGALTAPRSKLHKLQGGSLPRKKGATLAVIAAGTGLGECALVWDGRNGGFVPLGTEGGHTDFAPQSALETELYDYLLGLSALHPDGNGSRHVSYERIVSGPGLGRLYDFFRDVKKMPEAPKNTLALGAAPDRNAAIARLGASGESALARGALELFASLYGAEAGNLALKTLATGGVFVAGGIAASLANELGRGPFLTSFAAKGRMRPLLEKVPIAVVLDSKVGLAGSVYHAAHMT
jgi:glucokinase